MFDNKISEHQQWRFTMATIGKHHIDRNVKKGNIFITRQNNNEIMESEVFEAINCVGWFPDTLGPIEIIQVVAQLLF